MVTFDHSHQASGGYTLTIKEFGHIISGHLDNPNSSVSSYLSDDNDKPDLQIILIEESCPRYLNQNRLIQLKLAQQKHKRKTKKASVTTLLKQINRDCQASINNVVVIDLVEPNHNSDMYQLCTYFHISDIITLQ